MSIARGVYEDDVYEDCHCRSTILLSRSSKPVTGPAVPRSGNKTVSAFPVRTMIPSTNSSKAPISIMQRQDVCQWVVPLPETLIERATPRRRSEVAHASKIQQSVRAGPALTAQYPGGEMVSQISNTKEVLAEA